MPSYEVTFKTNLNVTVTITAPDEDTAAEAAWDAASTYADTITGAATHGVAAEASFDGITEDIVKEIKP